MASTDTTCQKFDQLLWAFVDGDMSESDRIFWNQHVQNCDRCQNTLNDARALELAYQRLPEYDPPETIIMELIGKATSPNRLKRNWKHLRNHLTNRRIWQSSLLGALVVVGSVLLVNAFRHKRSV